MPHLSLVPGKTLRLLVMSTGPRHCAGIDLASGALLRAWSPAPVDRRLRPYDLVDVTVAANTDLVPDPCEPEGLATAGPPQLVGRLTGRPARRLISPLLHPERQPLLGSHGPAVPFWERSGDHPSIALVRPPRPLIVRVEGGPQWWRLQLEGRAHGHASTHPPPAPQREEGGQSLALLREGTLLVVALAPPANGHCHKVVEAVVPPR